MSEIQFVEKETAFKRRIITYELQNTVHKDLSQFLIDSFSIFEKQTEKIMSKLFAIKVNCCLELKFVKQRVELTDDDCIVRNRANSEESSHEYESEKSVYDSESDKSAYDSESDKSLSDDTSFDSYYSSSDDSESEESDDECDFVDDEIDFETDEECVENEDEITHFFQTKNEIIFSSTKLAKWYDKHVVEPLNKKVSEFEGQGSGWRLSEIIGLTVNNNKYVAFSGSSYLPLPPEIKHKKAVINIRNHDEKCFMWSILAALCKVQNHAERVSNYRKHVNKINLDGISFPVTLNQIKIFEKNNPRISVNVYVTEEERSANSDEYRTIIVPVLLTNKVKKHHVHLLLLYDEDDKEENFSRKNILELMNTVSNKLHYCWIKDLAKLINSSVTQRKNRIFICDRCLHYFHTTEKLTNHQNVCEQLNSSKITSPTDDEKWLKFKNHDRQLEVPYIIYADIEAILSDVSNQKSKDMPKGAFQRHIAHSIGYYFHCKSGSLKSYYLAYTGTDCIDWFCNEMKKLVLGIWNDLQYVRPMKKMMEQQVFEHENATSCHICKQKFEIGDLKIHDHSHLTGLYRGAAHQICNLNYKESRNVPVVFHNLQYDQHFLIEKIAGSCSGDISIIPINNEKYISFTKRYKMEELIKDVEDDEGDLDFDSDISNIDSEDLERDSNSETDEDDNKIESSCNEPIKLRFIDSFRFMPESLQKLATYLGSNQFKISKKVWKNLSEEEFEMITRKGVYPYDYMNSPEKMNETQLPSIENFYNRLNDCQITEQEYEFAKKVWSRFNVKNMKEYTEIYLKVDITILADIFENFRYECSRIYHLDPAHYFTTPGYSWDAMLKQTGVMIELLTDIDQVLFIERGLRGGICQCSHRYFRANNKYMSDYDENEITKYLMYFDVNGLYGYTMCETLPIANFQWVDSFSIEEILLTEDDSKYGYFLEVDLDYPNKLHDAHNDYPMCAEKMCIGKSNQEKLILSLSNKVKYVLHYRTLKFVLKHGLILKCVHKVLRFEQSKWLKPFIEINTTHRLLSKNPFEKKLFKLINNAIYGKSLENVKKRCDVKLTNCWYGRYGAKSFISRPNFKSSKIFNKNLVAIEMNKMNVKMDKPMIIGVSILEISNSISFIMNSCMQIIHQKNVKWHILTQIVSYIALNMMIFMNYWKKIQMFLIEKRQVK